MIEDQSKHLKPKYQEDKPIFKRLKNPDERDEHCEVHHLKDPEDDYGKELLDDEMLYRLLIDNILKVKENLENRRDFPFSDDDASVLNIIFSN